MLLRGLSSEYGRSLLKPPLGSPSSWRLINSSMAAIFPISDVAPACSSTSMLAAYFMLTIITIDSILIVLHSSVFLV